MRKRKATPNPAAVQKRVYDGLKRTARHGAVTVDELASTVRLDEQTTEQALHRLAKLGLAHETGRSLFGARWSPGAPARSLFENPAPLFGSRERQMVYGDKYGGSRSGARADRVKALRAKARKEGTAKAEAARHAAYLATQEAQAEARERAREARTLAAILQGGAHAMKVARMDGRPFHRSDLEGFVASGWGVFPASTVSSKAGSGLPGWTPASLYLNPEDAITRALGRNGAARAVVVASTGTLSRGDVESWRAAGFDVSPAPARLRKVRPVFENPRRKGPQGTTARERAAEDGGMKRTATPRSEAKALARVRRRWTGEEPSKVLALKLDSIAAGLKLPDAVVLLGRVKAMVSPDGTAREWTDRRAPFLVTDATARKAWLLSEHHEAVDMQVSVLSYIAKKPKFGDSVAAEYVHRFARPARARLHGQAGTLTGNFRLTARGIEG
jgi:hypothetical protein